MPLDVMIVDDSAAVRKVLHRVLMQAGVQIGNLFEAGDGQDAMAQLRDVEVGLILSDISMPVMDGLQFLAALKAQEHTRDVPVIMVSSDGSSSKVLEAASLGAAGCVHKPFTAEQIKEKVVAILKCRAG